MKTTVAKHTQGENIESPELPYCRIQNVVDIGLAERQAASSYLKQLVELNLLEERTVGREKLIVNRELLRLLTQDDTDESAAAAPASLQN